MPDRGQQQESGGPLSGIRRLFGGTESGSREERAGLVSGGGSSGNGNLDSIFARMNPTTSTVSEWYDWETDCTAIGRLISFKGDQS